QAANVYLTRGPNGFRFVSDDSSAFVNVLDHADGTVLSVTSEQFADRGNQPTVLEVTYTNKSVDPWAQTSAPLIKLPGVDDGSIPWRKSQVPMPWIDNEELALKEGALRINKLRLRD